MLVILCSIVRRNFRGRGITGIVGDIAVDARIEDLRRRVTGDSGDADGITLCEYPPLHNPDAATQAAISLPAIIVLPAYLRIHIPPNRELAPHQPGPRRSFPAEHGK